MWIWELRNADGGDVAAIAARARAAGISTVFVKSSDGAANRWAQFNPELVAALKANGLRACAWQYVYGNDPLGEASLGADAIADGADCLVIDAESEYKGKYAAAQQYIAALRATVGPAYPIGLHLVPVRRLPRDAALLGLPQPRRRAGQPAAGLLEGHRRHRRRRLGPLAGPEPHLRHRDRPARADLRQRAAGGHRPLPRAVGGLRQRRAVVVVLAAHRRARLGRARAAGRPAGASARRPGLAHARPRAQRRPGRVAAAAPRRLRPGGDGHEDVRRRDRPGAAQLPELRAACRSPGPPTR